jgi:cyclase
MGRFTAKNLVYSLLCLSLLSCFCVAADFGKVTGQKVAEGVYLFTTTPYGDAGLSGNSVAILSNEEVLVFDSNGTPETAATVLAEIHKLTDKPVRYLVNSHWHWDHWAAIRCIWPRFLGFRSSRMKKRASLC